MNTQHAATAKSPKVSISEVFSQFASESNLDSIPPELRERAKYLMLDAIGVGLAASTYDFSQKTFAALSDGFGGGDSDVIGFSQRLGLRDAVLMNGALIHGIDFDDTYTPGYLHASASCFPTALALSAALGRSGADFLVAYVIGMEVAARVAAVAGNRFIQQGFHPTGLCAAFGCAVIAGRLHGLDAQRSTMAQGIVLSMAAGTREFSTEGAWSKRVHPGWAGVAGITSAVLAKGGFIGPRATYEGQAGLYATHLSAESGYDLAAATVELGQRWEMRQVAVKPFSVCQLCMATIDASIALAGDKFFNISEIERIDVLIQPHAVKIVCEPIDMKRRPPNSYAAQFSIPYAVACALKFRKFGLAELEHYADAEVLSVAEKVYYSIDPTVGTPVHHNSGEVIITMRGGKKLRHRESINRGGADHPISNSDIAAKYHQNAGMTIEARQADKIKEMVINLETLKNTRVLSNALSKSS